MKWDIYKLKKIGAVLKRAWHDPVGSKLIAGAISIVLLTVLASVSRVSSPEGVPEKTSVPVPVSPAGTANIPPSYRVQSPDVSRAARDVHIKYAAAESSSPEGGMSEKTSATVVPASTATPQSSYRIQSPNVTDVHGNVDIEYGFSEGGSKEKSAVGKK